MKKNGIKVFAIILFVLQLVLGVKSFVLIKDMLDNGLSNDISFYNRFTLFASFLLNILITGVLVILIFNVLANLQSRLRNDNDGVSELKGGKKRKTEKKEQETDNSEEKKPIFEKLNFELDKATDLEAFTEKILINISKVYDIMQGLFFVKDKTDNVFRKIGAYAYYSEDEVREFTEEVGLSGQVAVSKKLLNISNIPEKYITVLSGLGKSSPANLLILPIVHKDESIGIIELASFKKFDTLAETILSDFGKQISGRLSGFPVSQETTAK